LISNQKTDWYQRKWVIHCLHLMLG
jgi:hypothetical protein